MYWIKLTNRKKEAIYIVTQMHPFVLVGEFNKRIAQGDSGFLSYDRLFISDWKALSNNEADYYKSNKSFLENECDLRLTTILNQVNLELETIISITTAREYIDNFPVRGMSWEDGYKAQMENLKREFTDNTQIDNVIKYLENAFEEVINGLMVLKQEASANIYRQRQEAFLRNK